MTDNSKQSEAVTSKDVVQGPWWTPTISVEHLMARCKLRDNDTTTIEVEARMLEGLCWESLKWRQEAGERQLAKLRLSPDQTAGDDASDAAKWRAFRNCARIRVLGSAGFLHRENQYRFLTLEAWTQHDAQSSAEALDMLEEFVAVAQRCSPVEPSENCVSCGTKLRRPDTCDACGCGVSDVMPPVCACSYDPAVCEIHHRPEKASGRPLTQPERDAMNRAADKCQTMLDEGLLGENGTRDV